MSSPLPVVVFSHGGALFGLEAVRVAGRGLVDDQAASVVSFSALFASQNEHQAVPCEPVTQWLRLTGDNTDWLMGLHCDADLIELEPDDIFALPETLVQRCHFEPLKALGLHQQRLVALLDADLLTQLAMR